MKRTGFAITVLLTLALALGYIASLGMLSPIPSVHGASRTIMLSGSFATGWNGTNPGPTITVTQGDTVALTLVSSDSAPHTFVIDVAHAGVIANPNCSVDKCSPQFPPTQSFRLTADMAPGTYTYYCSIHLQHMTGSITVRSGSGTAPDFSAAPNPTTLAIAQGSSGFATITLTSLNSFSGTVTLVASVSPNGPAVSLSSTNLALTSSGPVSTRLTVSAASGGGYYSTSVSPGSYTVTVTETSGSLSHTTTIPLSVGATGPGSGSPGSSSSMPIYSSGSSGSLLLIGAGVLIVIVAAIVVAVARPRARK